MSKAYWQDGKWHEAEKPMSDEKMYDTEVFFEELIANEADIQKQKKYAEFAWETYSIKVMMNEQDEQDQAA